MVGCHVTLYWIFHWIREIVEVTDCINLCLLKCQAFVEATQSLLGGDSFHCFPRESGVSEDLEFSWRWPDSNLNGDSGVHWHLGYRVSVTQATLTSIISIQNSRLGLHTFLNECQVILHHMMPLVLDEYQMGIETLSGREPLFFLEAPLIW